ncbi:hypothetical protein ACFUCH_21135 [Streptomyces olivaceus]|uniref:hypothetical protein n=1 Tax=Streptomyces olivaceus TaxID=47716 RepID=UPI003641FEB9
MKRRAISAVTWKKMVLSIVVCTFGVSGCYASTDYERYPSSVEIQREDLVREWVSDSVRITFKGEGTFLANDLKLEYFECPLEGVQVKSGKGTWRLFEGGNGSEISLLFDDECSGVLRAGERDKEVVLWGSYSDRDDVLVLE